MLSTILAVVLLAISWDFVLSPNGGVCEVLIGIYSVYQWDSDSKHRTLRVVFRDCNGSSMSLQDSLDQ